MLGRPVGIADDYHEHDAAESQENFEFAPNNGGFIFTIGGPNLTILENTFTTGGSPIPQADAIHIG
jgi:hypothetical protein